MKSKYLLRNFSFLGIITTITAAVLPLFAIPYAHAANFSQAYVRLDRMQASSATTGTICAKPGSSASQTHDVQVTFPTGFTVGAAANWTVNTSNLPSGATAWNVTTANNVAGQIVTFPMAADAILSTSNTYCFNWINTAALTNATAGNDKTGSITTRTSGAATIDSGNYAVSIISNDQVTINATVPPNFTMNFAGGTDNFASNLSTTTTSTSGKTAQVITNAPNGWVIWVKSANAGLNSASTGASISTAGSIDAAPTDLASNTGYVLDTDLTTDSATAGTGTVTIDPEYNGANTTSGGTLSTNFQPIASASGVTDGDTVTLIERAKISAIQKAANDYTDTLTVVAAGKY